MVMTQATNADWDGPWLRKLSPLGSGARRTPGVGASGSSVVKLTPLFGLLLHSVINEPL